jgi:hypothetical protein
MDRLKSWLSSLTTLTNIHGSCMDRLNRVGFQFNFRISTSILRFKCNYLFHGAHSDVYSEFVFSNKNPRKRLINSDIKY